LNYDAISLRHDLSTCRQYGAAIISMPETNVNWNRPDQFAIFHSATRRTWSHSMSIVSRSPEDFLSN
jgi:hypothetical protein